MGMKDKARTVSFNNKGRPKGTPNPDGVEKIRRQHHNLYASLLQTALTGDAAAVRLCFELTGEHPKQGKGESPKTTFPLPNSSNHKR